MRLLCQGICAQSCILNCAAAVLKQCFTPLDAGSPLFTVLCITAVKEAAHLRCPQAADFVGYILQSKASERGLVPAAELRGKSYGTNCL